MANQHKVLPKEVHYTEVPCQILADMNSRLVPDYLELFERYPFADGLRDISICHSAAPPDTENLVEQVRRGKLSWIGVGWLIFIHAFVNAARQKGMTARRYADWTYDQAKAINDAVGFQAAWIEAYGEIANSITWPKGKRFTKKEALAYFRAWLKDGRSHTEHWRSISPPETISYYTHALQRDPNLRNLPIYYTEGALLGLHEAFRLGFPLVVYEGGCGTEDTFQTGIAFVRGGAKVFDGFWGADLSPCTGGPQGDNTEVTHAGTWYQGMTSDQMFRIWLTTYLAGCNMLLHEASYCFFYTHLNDGGVLPSDYGYKAMQLYRLTQGVLADRGTAVAPFAVMLEEEHGYRGGGCREFSPDGKLTTSDGNKTADTRLGIWKQRLDKITRGDWQVHRTFQTIFPASDNLWGKLMGQWPDKPEIKPAGLYEHMKVGQVDPRGFEKFLRDSFLADCFDVVPEDAALDVLKKYYKVILLAGEIKTDRGLWDRIKDFAAGGGTAVLSLEQLDETARRDLGLEIQASKSEVVGKERLLLSGVKFPKGKLKVHKKAPKSRKPLLLTLSKGKGRIFILLFSYGMDKDGKKLSVLYQDLLRELYAEHVGVEKTSPGCQMLINRRNEDTLVTLLNHTDKDWSGEILFPRRKYPPVGEVCDLIRDFPYPADLVKFRPTTVAVQVRVPAFEVKILSFGPRREHQAYKDVFVTTNGMTEDDVRYLDEIKAKGPKAVLGVAED